VPDLVALDARTGRLCPGFGQSGRAALERGMTPAPFGLYYVSSAPQLIRGSLLVGGSILDNQFWGAPSGVVRAFDAVTGELAWAFDVGRPERRGGRAGLRDRPFFIFLSCSGRFGALACPN
jgi:quinoprotein glucose dehydrogenase